jgi:hypothetical protein
MTRLKTAIGSYPHTKGLKDDSVKVPDVEFEHVEISPIIGAFRRMCAGRSTSISARWRSRRT